MACRLSLRSWEKPPTLAFDSILSYEGLYVYSSLLYWQHSKFHHADDRLLSCDLRLYLPVNGTKHSVGQGVTHLCLCNFGKAVYTCLMSALCQGKKHRKCCTIVQRSFDYRRSGCNAQVVAPRKKKQEPKHSITCKIGTSKEINWLLVIRQTVWTLICSPICACTDIKLSTHIMLSVLLSLPVGTIAYHPPLSPLTF